MTAHDNTDNGGPKVDPEFEAIVTKIEDLYGEARNWADGEAIASQEQAEAITALFDGLHAAGNEAETLRKKRVKPMDDAKAEIQTQFHPLIGDTKAGKGKVVLGKSALQSLLTAWRVEQNRIAEAAAKKAREEAEADRLRAEEAIRASAGNLEAREEAEELVGMARDAERFAKRQEWTATTGTGLRTRWVADIKDEGAALDWAYGRDPVRFRELVQRMADEAVSGGLRTVPGFDVREEKVAAVGRAA